jgi:tagatose-6-phosphate ketose/aldose isomerase
MQIDWDNGDVKAGTEETVLSDPLQALLDLSEEEKRKRGVLHTPQEIFQQPHTWPETYRRCVKRKAELSTFLKESGVGGELAPVIYLVGAGTSDYVGRCLTNLIRERWNCESWAVPSTGLLTNLENYVLPGRKYLWISFSRSGDSSEGVAVLERALADYPQIRHLVVTCNQAGSMVEACARRPDKAMALVLDQAVNDRGLAMTSSFTNMVVAGQCLAHLESLGEYEQIVTELVETAKRNLSLFAQEAGCLARVDFSKACFAGSGTLAAVAEESALKLLELTAGKIPTLSQSALGLRHGPMSVLDADTLFVLFLSNQERRRNYELDLLREIRAKQLVGVAVVVTPVRFEGVESIADRVLSLDFPAALGDEYRPPVDIIFGQLLGLFSSLNAGLPPDRPSPTGAISRVVSHVTIYS